MVALDAVSSASSIRRRAAIVLELPITPAAGNCIYQRHTTARIQKYLCSNHVWCLRIWYNQLEVGGAKRSIEECLVVVDGHGLAEEVFDYIDGSGIILVCCFGKSC